MHTFLCAAGELYARLPHRRAEIRSAIPSSTPAGVAGLASVLERAGSDFALLPWARALVGIVVEGDADVTLGSQIHNIV